MMRATLHFVSAADYAALRPALQPMLDGAMESVLRQRGAVDVAQVVPEARKLLRKRPAHVQRPPRGARRALPRLRGPRDRLRRPDAAPAADGADGRPLVVRRATPSSRSPSRGSAASGCPRPTARRSCGATSARSGRERRRHPDVVGAGRAAGGARRHGGRAGHVQLRPAHALRPAGRAAAGRGRRGAGPAAARVRQPHARPQGPHARDRRRPPQGAGHEEPARPGDVPRRRARGRQLGGGAQARRRDAHAVVVRAADKAVKDELAAEAEGMLAFLGEDADKARVAFAQR